MKKVIRLTESDLTNIIMRIIKENDDFTKEMSELMDIDITINHDKINFEDLNLSTAKVKDLLRIDFLFM